MDIRSYINKLFILSLIWLSTASIASGQQANPFELIHRLKKMDIETDVYEEANDSVLTESSDSLYSDTNENQISLLKPDSSHESQNDTLTSPLQSSEAEDSSASANEPTAEERASGVVEEDEIAEVPMPELLQSKRNLIFGTFITLSLFLTVVISFNRQIVNHILRSILNDNYMNMLHRDQKGRWSMQFIFLYIFFLANLALFIFLVVDQWGYEKITGNLLILFFIIAGIYVLRHFSLNYIGSTFNIDRETGQFSFTIMLFNIFLGLLLLPVNLFIAFAPSGISNFFIYIGLIVIGLTFLLRQLRGLFIANRYLFDHKFHFLLYLCTVEIAPVWVLIKFFQPYFN